MKREKVTEALAGVGVDIETERAVPINGTIRHLPYLVIRTEEQDEKSDTGRVTITRIDWTVSLFSTNKDFALECKIRRALAGAGAVEVTRYPDGTPYQTDFAFSTKGVNNG